MSDEPQVEPHQCSVCGGAMGAHTAECKAHSLQRPGYAAGVESEVCRACDGVGSITYNPNLNPNAFPATAFATCKHCDGMGRIEPRQPQHNAELCRSAAKPKGTQCK